MRLSQRERGAILAAVRGADPQAKIYLFGSRTDDSLRGGDIDLLVLSERLKLPDKIGILSHIKDALGEQKIDLLLKSESEAARDAFVAQVLKSAVRLAPDCKNR